MASANSPMAAASHSSACPRTAARPPTAPATPFAGPCSASETRAARLSTSSAHTPMPIAPVTAAAELVPLDAAYAAMSMVSSSAPTAATAISAAFTHALRSTASQPAVHTAPSRHNTARNWSQRPACARSPDAPGDEDASVASDASTKAVPNAYTTAPAASRATGVSDLMMRSTRFSSSHAPHRTLQACHRYAGNPTVLLQNVTAFHAARLRSGEATHPLSLLALRACCCYQLGCARLRSGGVTGVPDRPVPFRACHPDHGAVARGDPLLIGDDRGHAGAVGYLVQAQRHAVGV